MPPDLHILFCESPLEKNRVDPDFEAERIAAEQNGFETALINFEDLVSSDRRAMATKRIKPAPRLSPSLYRGWMLNPEQYAFLYENLLSKNYRLINSPQEYRNCHYLPESLKYIGPKTPHSIYEKLEDAQSLDRLLEKAAVFGDRPVLVKDYVKSEKHYWDTACFVPKASDTAKLKTTVDKLIELRGKELNEGIVIREFVELTHLALHSRSGMPLTEEYRLFFFKGELLCVCDYWEEGDYGHVKPETGEFEALAKAIESNFFSMDIARVKDGALIIVELGDGQVSGLPDTLDKTEFYRRLASLQ